MALTCFNMPVDIDECNSTYHGCSHQCNNVPGGYNCNCNEGYYLQSNGRECQGTYVHVYIYNKRCNNEKCAYAFKIAGFKMHIVHLNF